MLIRERVSIVIAVMRQIDWQDRDSRLADTALRAEKEWLERRLLVVGKVGVLVKPALRSEGVGVVEVSGRLGGSTCGHNDAATLGDESATDGSTPFGNQSW